MQPKIAIFHNPPFLLLLFYVLFISVLPFNITSSPMTEAQALVKWKNTLITPSSLHSWSLNNIENLCNWTGITCNSAGTVSELHITYQKLNVTLAHFNFSSFPNLTSLDMSYNNLNGNIPPEIGMLKNFTKLYLNSNNLTGPIPKEIGNLKQLQYLVLSRNHLAGSIPSTIGNLTNLISLYLDSNHLSGTIPPEIGNLTQVAHFHLENNQLNGELPDSIYNLSNLLYIYLNSNKFSGTIRKDFGPLLTLDLSKNNFSGEIPVTICKSAESLDFSSNSFSGVVTPCLTDLGTTVIINLRENQFQGTIPSSLCKATSLTVLDLSSNRLSGELPYCLGNMRISILDLHENQIQGTIPQTFTKSCRLTTFNLNNNHVEGKIPPALANCKLLQILDLGSNKISGIFPPWLVILERLQILVLRSNRLYGKIRVTKIKHQFPKLRIMDLSHNQLSGNLPIEFFDNFKHMVDADQSFGLSTSNLVDSFYEASVLLTVKGNDIEVKRILYIYSNIDLSSNRFNGTVPHVIGELKSLRLLNLSHNSITGHIPSLLGNMRSLESLDFSSNQLTGTIPWQLISLTSLSTLNLSENYLSGVIPQERHFDTFTNDSFLGNAALCGAPLTKKCNDDELPTREIDDDDDVDVNWFNWQMILLGYGSGLVCGLSTGYIVFTISKPLRFVMFIGRAQQKLIQIYMNT